MSCSWKNKHKRYITKWQRACLLTKWGTSILETVFCALHVHEKVAISSPFCLLNTLPHTGGTNILPAALGFTLRGAIKHAISAFSCQNHKPPSKHSHALHSSHTVSDSHASFMISNIRPAVSRRELTCTCEMPAITRKSSPIEGKVWATQACQERWQADGNNFQGEKREAKALATHTQTARLSRFTSLYT